MNIARRIEIFFLGDNKDAHKDAVIAGYRAEMAQNAQVVQSGTRLIDTMSGMIKLMVDEHHVQK